MYRKLFNILLLLPAFFALVACGGSSSDEPDPGPQPPKSVERTVLVYMVADNNLGTSNQLNTADLNEMVKGAAQGDLNGGRLLVYHNRPGTATGNYPVLLEVTSAGIDTLKAYPDDVEIYSVEASRMREVLADMKEYAPAGDYGLVLWGHADGWLSHGSSDVKSSAPAQRSYGHDRNHWMSLTSLREALAGEQFSFIYFDCCLMGGVEVAYELRESTPRIIASPTELEGEGMPYHLNLSAFFASGSPDVVSMARNTFEYYNLRAGYNCQMTVIDTSALEGLANATRAIFATQQSFSDALWSVQKLSRNVYSYLRPATTCTDCCVVYDMGHYMEILAGDRTDLLDAWKAALAGTVLYQATTARDFTGIIVNRYCGLGSYVVRLSDHGDYHGYKDCRWWTDVVSTSPVFN